VTRRARRTGAVLATAVAAATLSACGSDGGAPKAPEGVNQSAFERQLKDAQTVSAADFPATDGRTLAELATTAEAGPQAVLASSVFLPGDNRLAFGVLTSENESVYGKTAVYVARTPDAPAEGPYPAPADSLVTRGRYRSKQAVLGDSPLASIYAAQVPLKSPGRYSVLVLTQTPEGMLQTTTELKVRRDTDVPAVGEKPPPLSTDTVAKAGSLELVDTRIPPARQLHDTDFKDVIGKRPVALVFATPQLCQSRVCGPVVDIALQLQAKYGDQMAFIHQEVYVDNQVDKGLRPALKAFNLPTEPWLFTFDADGRVAARLEGSFGLRAFEEAVKAAL
jgi:hypothetical protein